MRPRKMPQKQMQTDRAPAEGPETKPPARKAGGPSANGLSVRALIKHLGGSLKGGPSLIAALKRDRRNDDHAKARKFAVMGEGRDPEC